MFGILSLVSFMLAGFCNALMDSRLDLMSYSKVYQYCQKKGGKILDWYMSEGGNRKWNPSFPSIPFLNIWFSDFWHTSKWFMLFWWTMGVCFAVLSEWSWYWFLFAHGLHGFTFIYFYHYYLPINSNGNIFEYLKRVLKFWENAHK